jgi:hypothetical protein
MRVVRAIMYIGYKYVQELMFVYFGEPCVAIWFRTVLLLIFVLLFAKRGNTHTELMSQCYLQEAFRLVDMCSEMYVGRVCPPS